MWVSGVSSAPCARHMSQATRRHVCDCALREISHLLRYQMVPSVNGRYFRVLYTTITIYLYPFPRLSRAAPLSAGAGKSGHKHDDVTTANNNNNVWPRWLIAMCEAASVCLRQVVNNAYVKVCIVRLSRARPGTTDYMPVNIFHSPHEVLRVLLGSFRHVKQTWKLEREPSVAVGCRRSWPYLPHPQTRGEIWNSLFIWWMTKMLTGRSVLFFTKSTFS